MWLDSAANKKQLQPLLFYKPTMPTPGRCASTPPRAPRPDTSTEAALEGLGNGGTSTRSVINVVAYMNQLLLNDLVS